MKGNKGCKSTLKVYKGLYKVWVCLFYAKNTYSLVEIKKFHKFFYIKLNKNYLSGFELTQLISLCYWIKYLCSNFVYIKTN